MGLIANVRKNRPTATLFMRGWIEMVNEARAKNTNASMYRMMSGVMFIVGPQRFKRLHSCVAILVATARSIFAEGDFFTKRILVFESREIFADASWRWDRKSVFP